MIPKFDWYQWLKYTYLSFGKSRHLEEFNMLIFIVKTVCCSKKKFSTDLGSPDSHQLLQLQLFSQIFEILDPPFILYCLILFGFMNSICFLTAASWIVLRTTIFVLFGNFLMSETVGLCPFDWWYLSFGSLFRCFRRRSGGKASYFRYPAEGLLELSV